MTDTHARATDDDDCAWCSAPIDFGDLIRVGDDGGWLGECCADVTVEHYNN